MNDDRNNDLQHDTCENIPFFCVSVVKHENINTVMSRATHSSAKCHASNACISLLVYSANCLLAYLALNMERSSKTNMCQLAVFKAIVHEDKR